MTDQNNGTRRPRQARSQTLPVGRAHLVDALGERTTGAIEALTRVVVAPLEKRVKVLEDEKDEMERRLTELSATIEKSVLVRLVAAQSASHEAWMEAVGIVQTAKEDIVTAADGGPVTAELGREAKGIADEASTALEASEKEFEQSLLDFDALARRVEAVEEVLGMQADGTSARLVGIEAAIARVKPATDDLTTILGYTPTTRRSAWVGKVNTAIGHISTVVDANARATAEALEPNPWTSPWFWGGLSGAVTAGVYALCVNALEWSWKPYLSWIAFNALAAGVVAWAIFAIVRRRPHFRVNTVAEANATASVLSDQVGQPQYRDWNAPMDQMYGDRATSDATQVDASASAQASS